MNTSTIILVASYLILSSILSYCINIVSTTWPLGLGNRPRLLISIIIGCVVSLIIVTLWMSRLEQQIQGSETFPYQVYVQASGKNVVGANVTVEIGGTVPKNEITDNNGIASIEISAAYINKPARLRVDAPGYQHYSINVIINKDTLPLIVPLQLN